MYKKIRAMLRNWKYRYLFPGADIAKDSIMFGKNTVEENFCLESGGRVADSIFGRHVVISKNTQVGSSIFEGENNIGERCRILDVTVGRFSYLSEGSVLNLVEVGRYCSIGPWLIAGYGNHPTTHISTSPVFYYAPGYSSLGFDCVEEEGFISRKKIFIGHDVWIGARVFIRDGIRIGNGAIVGAGAVVVSDVPDYAIVGGVPAKLIRFRFSDENISELNKIAWWNWESSKLRLAVKKIASEDIGHFIEWANGQRQNNEISIV